MSANLISVTNSSLYVLSTSRTVSSSYYTVDEDFKHVFEGFLSTYGPISLNVTKDSALVPVEHVIKHVLPDGTSVQRKKRSEGYSRSKNTARMREKRKDPEYRKRENERRKRQRREERAREKEDPLLRIPNYSVLSETPGQVTNRTGTTLHNNTVRKEVKTIRVTIFTHEPIKEADKENTTDVVVYRNDKGSIRRAWHGDSNILLNFQPFFSRCVIRLVADYCPQ